ncbi:hypothetical protein CEXT_622011 [Caerostris extrusa]|uniref:Uncharacterized protein n=1 Tax=Caerostris extrusa TaxID=172846 RepID=A0AAV4Y8B6_CAEEX|nr:hypothetical protein CEXT_622011 [Caerostris extrusa]
MVIINETQNFSSSKCERFHGAHYTVIVEQSNHLGHPSQGNTKRGENPLWIHFRDCCSMTFWTVPVKSSRARLAGIPLFAEAYLRCYLKNALNVAFSEDN